MKRRDGNDPREFTALCVQAGLKVKIGKDTMTVTGKYLLAPMTLSLKQVVPLGMIRAVERIRTGRV